MNSKTLKPTIVTSVLILLSILALTGAVDQKSTEYTDEAFKRALITFGIARGLNGVISVAQGTEVALHPAGLGVNFTPGQILDPINDLVEQFSWVMLASSASLGIQKVLLKISATQVVTVLFLTVLTVYLLSIWKKELFNSQIRYYINLSVVIVLFVRFSVPVAMLASEGLYRLFLQEQYSQASVSLEKTRDDIYKLNVEDNQKYTTQEEGLVDMAKRLLNSTTQSMSINRQIDKYQQIATDTTHQAINIIVVFVMQTIMIPILFLWLSYRFCRLLWQKLLPE